MWFGLQTTFQVFAAETNSIQLNQTPETGWASILEARAELDKELQRDPKTLDPQDVKAIKQRILRQIGHLLTLEGDFHRKFPKDATCYYVQLDPQENYGVVLRGMLHRENSAIVANIAESVTSCLYVPATSQRLSISSEQASEMQIACELSFANAAIMAIKWGPESYNGVFPFLKRATTTSGNKLARAIVNDPAADEPLKRCARFVLNRSCSVGKPATLAFTGLDGRQVDTTKLRGKVVLVEFWATDCPPCLDQLPELESLYRVYRDRAFEVVGVSTDSDEKAVLRVIQQKKIPWPVYMDEDGWTNRFAVECGVYGIPDNWLIDRRGIVREVMAGSDLARKIELLLTEPP